MRDSLIFKFYEQGSDQWLQDHVGVATASNFGMIATPTGGASSQASEYMARLAAERVEGKKDSNLFKSYWMDRGNELEPMARRDAEFEFDEEILEIGMVFKDEKMLVACSPDGLMARGRSISRGIEIKSPKLSTYLGYVRDGRLPAVYSPQVHGSMHVMGVDEWIFYPYHPLMRPAPIVVKRCELTEKIGEHIDNFERMLKVEIDKAFSMVRDEFYN